MIAAASARPCCRARVRERGRGIDCLVVMWQGASESSAPRRSATGPPSTRRRPAWRRSSNAWRSSRKHRARARPSVRRPSRDRRARNGGPRDRKGLAGGGRRRRPDRRRRARLGYRDRASSRPRDRRRARGSAAFREGLAAGASVSVTPRSVADGLNAPYAGKLRPAWSRARHRVGPRLRGRDRGRLPLSLRAGEARRGPAGPPGWPHFSPKGFPA